MNDDRKKPFAGGKGGGKGTGKGRGPGKERGPGGPAAGREGGRPPRAARDGEAKPFRRQDGAKRAFAGREDGKPGKPRPGRWERREAAEGTGEERRPRKPFVPRNGDRPQTGKRDGEAKPFHRQDGAKRAFAGREDGKPGKPRPGRWEREQEKAGEGGERRPGKPFAPRGGDAPRPRPARREREEPAAAVAESGGERIARRLARAGVSSRRDAEAMIAAGRVTLNGRVLDTPAVNVGAHDRIEIDGKPIPAVERTRLFLFHKPAGVVTTSRDPEGRRTVFDVLPGDLPRLMTVGRLDINTEGLLLLTNDGGLSRVLELPATGWLRRYRVRVHGKVEQQALDALKEGIAVDGVFYGAVEAALDREQGSNAWLTVGLREGKNREVKNILGALGLEVTRLIRVSFGPFQLGDLAEGELRELKGRYLRDQLGERLIEESGANFDAPVLNPVSSRDAAAGEARSARPARPREDRPADRREDRRESRREDALGRLDTRKPPRGKPARKDAARPAGKGGFGAPKPGAAGKPGGRGERPEEKPRARTSNVWMAPGAKPLGEKKAAALAERSEGRRYAGKPRPAGKPGGKPTGKPGGRPGGRPDGRPGGRPGTGRGGPRKPRGEG